MKKTTTLIALTLFLGTVLAQAEPPTGRYLNIVTQMKALVADYPQYASVFSIGKNDDDVDIFAMRISVTPGEMNHEKIGHLVVSTHHGNESATPLFTMYYIKELLEKYGSAELWRTNLSDTEWTIVPVLNISGYNANRRQEHGYDPNRDYPGPCASNTGKLKSVREIMALMTRRIFTGSVSVHGYVGTLTYPWGMYTNKPSSLDDNYYAQITKKAAQWNGYRTGNHTIIYPANGCYEDYTYFKHGIWTLLLELRSGSQSDIRDTSKAIYAFFEQLDSSPSLNFQFEGSCTRTPERDFRLE